jgi:hypothetical protein
LRLKCTDVEGPESSTLFNCMFYRRPVRLSVQLFSMCIKEIGM